MLSVYVCCIFFIVSLCLSETSGSNLTDKFENIYEKDFRTRQQRLISFSSDGNLQLDLDFNVPFITLPIKRSMDMAKTSLLEVNIGSVVVAGAIVFGAIVILPLALAFFNKKMLIPSDNPFYKRMGTPRSEDSNVWRYLTVLDNALLENNIDITSCSQRIICWSVKNSSQNVSGGHGSSTDKILDGFASSKWVQDYFLSLTAKEAVKFGLERRNCSLIYGACKISQERLYRLVKRVLDRFNHS